MKLVKYVSALFYISALRLVGKTGVEIARVLYQRRVCGPDVAVKAFTRLGYWAKCLPYSQRELAFHITDLPVVLRDPTTERLKKFGSRALPFIRWIFKQDDISVPDNARYFFAAPPEVEEIALEYGENWEQLSCLFVWVAIRGYSERLCGLLDLTQAGEITFESEDGDLLEGIDFFEVFGFVEQGYLTHGTIFPFRDQDEHNLTFEHITIQVREDVHYDKAGFLVNGKIVISYDPFYQEEADDEEDE